MNKYIFFLAGVLLAHIVSAQVLTINGNIVIDESGTEGARIVITKNNEPLERKEIGKRGRFDLKLALGADYKLSFEKDGYVSKIVSINTEVPDEIVQTNPDFPPVKLIINLLPMVEGVDISIFEQPVAILAYDYELDDFNFDKEYSARIKDKIAQTEQEIRRTLARKGSEALAKEQAFQEFVSKGQTQFNQKKWQGAIDNWTQALTIKPDHAEVKEKLALARKENERELAEKSIAAQNARSYQLLITSGDSLFDLQHYPQAKEKYLAAQKVNDKDTYPARKIAEIDNLIAQQLKERQQAEERQKLVENYRQLIAAGDSHFGKKEYDLAESDYQEALALNYEKEYPTRRLQAIAEIRKQESERQKQEATLLATYHKLIAEGDRQFQSKAYEPAISSYRQAQEVKPAEAYPRDMIAKAEQALALLQQQQAADAEKKRQEELRKAELMKQYTQIISEADAAFKAETYAIARNLYQEADKLNTGETYPGNRLKEIDNILNSSKYQQRLAEYNKNITLGEKALTAKNYAGAKVYYEKAASILPIDKAKVQAKIAEINQLIEAEQLALIRKEYQKQIDKADKAYQDKSYAIAKFYYQKALEVKKDDKYAKQQLEEVEKLINERSEKTMEL